LRLRSPAPVEHVSLAHSRTRVRSQHSRWPFPQADQADQAPQAATRPDAPTVITPPTSSTGPAAPSLAQPATTFAAFGRQTGQVAQETGKGMWSRFRGMPRVTQVLLAIGAALVLMVCSCCSCSGFAAALGGGLPSVQATATTSGGGGVHAGAHLDPRSWQSARGRAHLPLQDVEQAHPAPVLILL
jgi:hypothetical protein